MKDKQLRTVLNRHAARVARLKVQVRRNFLQAQWFFRFERSARSTVIMRILELHWALVKDRREFHYVYNFENIAFFPLHSS
jgi:hypothetical protein